MPAHIITTDLSEDIAETISAHVARLEAKGERVLQVEPLGHRFIILTEPKAKTQRAPEKRVSTPKETR